MSFIKRVLAAKRTRWILAAAVVAALACVAAYVTVTPDSQADASTFSTGSISLTLNNQTGEVAFTDLSMTSMKPGDDVYAGLNVGNAGSLNFKYSMSATSSGDSDLATAMTIGIAAVAGTSCTSGTYAAGTSLYSDAAGLGDATIDSRALSAGASDYLCFHVKLPSDAASTLQGKSASATFNFTAQAS